MINKVRIEPVPALPPYAKEILECDARFEDLIREIQGQRDYDVSISMLREGYETAKRLHGDVRRHSGELYLRHPLAVFATLAHLRCETSVLVAGLLHDTMEDCKYPYENIRSAFNYKVADIVQAVTAVKKEEETRLLLVSEDHVHKYLDLWTDEKLVKSKVQVEARLVRMADREHNLSTLEACPPEKRRLKVEQTRDFLIPATKVLGMRYFEVTLSDYCMKHEDIIPSTPASPPADTAKSHVYALLESQITTLTRASMWNYGVFEDALNRGLRKDKHFRYPRCNPFAPRLRGAGATYQPVRRRFLRPYEVAEQLPAGVTSFYRQDVCLNEIILTYSQLELTDPLSQFIQFHKRHLESSGIFLFLPSEKERCGYRFVLTDPMENNYCLRLIPEERLDYYFQGETRRLVAPDSRDAVRKTIPLVCSYSPRTGVREHHNLVPVGATALDFAFLLKEALAWTVKGVRIKPYTGRDSILFTDDDFIFPLGTTVNDGDVVFFDADYFGKTDPRNVDNSEIDWFSDVTTQSARMKLIEHFRGRVQPPQEEEDANAG